MKEQTITSRVPPADAVLREKEAAHSVSAMSAASQGATPTPAAQAGGGGALRIRSQDLFRQGREIEIDHEGRIYRLRRTQLNKLILTA